jgi:WD40 repeat protein
MLWKAVDGPPLKLIKSAVLSADGRRLVSGSNDPTVRVWDLESGECLQVFTARRACDLTSGMDIVYIGESSKLPTSVTKQRWQSDK